MADFFEADRKGRAQADRPLGSGNGLVLISWPPDEMKGMHTRTYCPGSIAWSTICHQSTHP
jgi:hypothetical protein